MNQEEMNAEILECARYGEHEDLQALLQSGANVDHKDYSGNSALHKASANGFVECLQVLKTFGATYFPNEAGNTPAHWAAQNGQLDALKFLIDNYDVDMLAQNSFNRSAVSEAFQSGSTEVVALCLSHSSATEEKLVSTNSKDAVMECETSEEADESKDAVTHKFRFGGDPRLAPTLLQVRELPITRADNPFGSDTAPEDDTTGLGLWPSSVLAARWALHHWQLMDGKVVAELGAGCGLPGLAVAMRSNARKVMITDIHDPTLSNAAFNIHLNADGEPGLAAATATATATPNIIDTVQIPREFCGPDSPLEGLRSYCELSVRKLNWADASTYPEEKIDVLVGSDLVYDVNILKMLVPVIKLLLADGGSFLYVAPNDGRAGMDEFCSLLLEPDSEAGASLSVVDQIPCPDEFYSDPLYNENEDESCSDEFILHFYDLSIRKPHTLYHFRKSTV